MRYKGVQTNPKWCPARTIASSPVCERPPPFFKRLDRLTLLFTAGAKIAKTMEKDSHILCDIQRFEELAVGGVLSFCFCPVGLLIRCHMLEEGRRQLAE